jgi:hypothetical protein
LNRGRRLERETPRVYEPAMTEQKSPEEPSPPAARPAPGLPTIDVNERGGKREGEAQVMDKRLFMQLLAFECPQDTDPNDHIMHLSGALERRGIAGVIYEDANDPRGIALLTWSEDPAHFVKNVRAALTEPANRPLRSKPELTMLGRTYSIGHEPDLAFTLLERPRSNVLHAEWPWAVWYPLRRSGAFAKLEGHEQGIILREHATIGMAYGQQDLAHDIRLACFGLDSKDNEFVIGLLAKDLHPISHCIQTMRKTKQTSEYIVQMGPFFVGYAVWRSAGKA